MSPAPPVMHTGIIELPLALIGYVNTRVWLVAACAPWRIGTPRSPSVA